MRVNALTWPLLLVLAVACGSDKKAGSKSDSGGGGNGGQGGSETTAGGNAGQGGDSGVASTTPLDDVPQTVDGEFPIPLKDGLAPTPPMGWSSWNKFACNINEEGVKRIADAMVSSGMKDAGYQYVNIDDCWQNTLRDTDGNVVPDPDFPSGMKALADYIHGLGLKLGLYSDRGTATCGGRAGALGYEKKDAETYAAWGIDYLKYDNCAAAAETIEADYKRMSDELKAATATTGRPIVYSICAWSFYEWALTMGQLWRTTSDITDAWINKDQSKGGVVASFVQNARVAAYAGPNGWNDPDMLEVGNGGLNEAESISHFNVWAMMAAPLIAGNDLVNMSESTKAILTNKEVIAINQDAYGLQGIVVASDSANQTEVWAKPLNGAGERAILLLNRDAIAHDITVKFADTGLGRSPVNLIQLWSKETLGEFRDTYTASAVPPHGSVMLKAYGIEPRLPEGTAYVSDLTWLYAANGTGPAERDLTNGVTAAKDGVAITLDGQTYEKGIGISAPSSILVRLGKACSRFKAKVNLQDNAPTGGSVIFHVYGDDALLFESAVMSGDSATADVDVSVAGKYRLKLFVSNAASPGGADKAVWADARLECD
jgi:alpha-galactosidase